MAQFHNYYVYILACSDNSYYVGVTNDIDARLYEHNHGEDVKAYTYFRRPLILKYVGHFNNINDAIAFEKQVKGWSRKKKEALFEEDWEEIVRLASIRKGPKQQD